VRELPLRLAEREAVDWPVRRVLALRVPSARVAGRLPDDLVPSLRAASLRLELRAVEAVELRADVVRPALARVLVPDSVLRAEALRVLLRPLVLLPLRVALRLPRSLASLPPARRAPPRPDDSPRTRSTRLLKNWPALPALSLSVAPAIRSLKMLRVALRVESAKLLR
jgi:hypothetical protein